MAVDTKTNLLARANQVRTETGGFANTASRLGSLFRDIIDSIIGPATGKFDVTDYGARKDGSNDPSAGFAAAAAAALAANGSVYVPRGTYGTGAGWTFDLPSGVTIEGDGDASVLLNCYITATGSAGSEKVFTAPAAKGATTISLNTSGIVTGSWLRVASIVNSQSDDAGIDKLGHLPLEYSSFAEWVQIETVGGSSVTIFTPLFFAYSNTPGPESNPAYSNQVSVARVMTFHEDGRIKRLKMLGKHPSQNNNIQARFCRGLVIEDVNVDTQDQTAQSIIFDYCVDCTMVRGGVVGKKTSVPSGSTADPICMFSSQRCVLRGVRIQNGRQGVFISYRNNDNTYRGGPSLACGAENCTAIDCDLDAFTSVWGCYGSYFVNCTNWGCTFGFRMRDRACQVVSCRSFSTDFANGAGVLLDAAAVVDALVSGNTVVGHLQNVQTDMTLSGYASLQAALGSSGALITGNVLRDAGDHGVFCNIAYTQATLVGPRITNNDIDNAADDGIQINSYWNGTIVAGNRFNTILAGKVGIRYGTNIKRLWIGSNHMYAMNATATAVTGGGISSFMTDLVTFPLGEAEAFLYIGQQFTDAAAGQNYGGVIRDATAYITPAVAGWQPFVSNIGNANPTLTRSMFAAWIDATVGHLRLRTLDSTAGVDRQYAAVIRGSGSPEGVVTAGIGELYSRTNGGASTTLYVKESGTGNTGWKAVQTL